MSKRSRSRRPVGQFRRLGCLHGKEPAFTEGARASLDWAGCRMKDDRLAELYRAHGPAIYERCRRLLRNEAAAEDATQEVFLKAHRHLGSAPEGAQAYAWLFRIATNVCLNQIRDAGTHLVKEQELATNHGGSRDIRGVLEDRVLARSLVLRVPEKLRLPAWLYYVDGLSQEEIAEVLAISRGTVINRLEAFREHGRKWLEREP